MNATTDWRDFIVPIGKYRGRRLVETSDGYLLWASENLPGAFGEKCREAVDELRGAFPQHFNGGKGLKNGSR